MALDSGPATGRDALAKLAEEHVDHRFKGLPPDAYGLTVAGLAGQRRNLFTGGFTSPVLALSAERLEHNLKLMETYSARHGLAFAPHGKTSMAPQLFHRQIEHGAWGITLAVPHQVRVARAFGIQRVLLATNWSTPPPCAGSPPSWTPTPTSASSATSTPCAARS
ncbi:Amino acid deaminase OS=Streptomyces tendae OX=1932 GN=GUR47_15805 PE=3 SV=1 [Streptomyces tendae]